ncbi:MAG: hydantoinase B/oxoprolinase family protein [Desulfurococcales archaeon]|nr:hydantoinase B/oxoprolinase family protein [Desulfurococcales archaeon]
MVDKITVEVIKNAAIYTSEEMGIVLRNTAYSPNIKDRLDHSCAILAPTGEIVAQAEHIPVHLGSMSIGVVNTVRTLKKLGKNLNPGDIVIVNDPYIAGTHLNDILAMKPVYYDGRLIAIVANKAHHVDVGGSVPGSIGGKVTELLQEGIVIPPVKIVKDGRLDTEILRLIESNVRTPRYFEGDLRAQIASLNVGEKRILDLAKKYGSFALLEAWSEILDYTERYTRRLLEDLGIQGSFHARDYLELEDKLVNIDVSITFDKDKLTVDFAGTHPQVDYPINAVYGVTVAATAYALKSVLDPEMPMNQGFLRVVEIKAPEGSLVNPVKPAPVSGGNVETSQRIADVVLRALAEALPDKVPAASCGSMNNIMIGGIIGDGQTWAFYETIGCGTGGRPCCDGVDAVHTNMTNTLNTPIEILEAEYPILFTRYEIRSSSGGQGKYRGGNGIIRGIKILSDKTTVSIVGERCRTRPWGLRGGMPGQPAIYMVRYKDGRTKILPSKATIQLGEGDEIIIMTAGGGGYGDPCKREQYLIEKDLEEGRIDEEWIKTLRSNCVGRGQNTYPESS